MRIGILGSGLMGGKPGTIFALAGHLRGLSSPMASKGAYHRRDASSFVRRTGRIVQTMKLHVEWTRPIPVKMPVARILSTTSKFCESQTPPESYVLGRRWGMQLEAPYVGKANGIRSRVKGQLNNLRLMQHLKNAKTGKRILLAGRLIAKPGQQLDRCSPLIERALIRYFLSGGHDLVNKQGTRLRRHELS